MLLHTLYIIGVRQINHKRIPIRRIRLQVGMDVFQC